MRVQPRTLAELHGIHGSVSVRPSCMDSGYECVEDIQRRCAGRRCPAKKTKPAEEDAATDAKGHSLVEIAKIRGRQMGSVVELVSSMIELGEVEFHPGWSISRNDQDSVGMARSMAGKTEDTQRRSTGGNYLRRHPAGGGAAAEERKPQIHHRECDVGNQNL